MSTDEILHEMNPTRLAFLRDYSLAIFLVILVVSVTYDGYTIANYALWAAIGLSVLIVAYAEYSRLRTRYTITINQAIVEQGIVSNSKKSLFFHNIADVHLRQNYLERSLNYGRVMLGSASGDNKLKLVVKEPAKLVSEIEKLMHEHYKKSATR